MGISRIENATVHFGSQLIAFWKFPQTKYVSFTIPVGLLQTCGTFALELSINGKVLVTRKYLTIVALCVYVYVCMLLLLFYYYNIFLTLKVSTCPIFQNLLLNWCLNSRVKREPKQLFKYLSLVSKSILAYSNPFLPPHGTLSLILQ